MSFETETFVPTVTGANTPAGERFYPIAAEQNAVFPYAVYTVVNTAPVEETGSPAAELNETVIDIACHAETAAGAKALARAVRAALIGGLEAAVIENERDERDPDTRRPAVVQTYRIWHEGIFP